MATRAKDSDRTEACRILDQALQDGQLSMAEHQQRISAATRAVTLGDLHGLIVDLQTESTPVQLAPAKPRLPFTPLPFNPFKAPLRVAIISLVAVPLLGIGLGWSILNKINWPEGFSSSVFDPGAKPDGVPPVVLAPPRQLHSLGGLTGLLEQARAKFGDTMGYRLVIYPDYASLDRPDPGEPRRQLSYSYRGGWGDPTRSATGSRAALVDLSQLDPKAAVGIMRGAPETLGIKAADVKSSYLIIEAAADPTAPGTLALSAYVSSDYGSGYIAFEGDGTIKRINYPS